MGFLNFIYHEKILPSKIIGVYSGKRVELTGRVVDLTQYDGKRFNFVLNTFPRILVKTKGDDKVFRESDIIKILCTLHPIGKDFPLYIQNYYKRKGVYLYTYVKNGSIVKIGSSPFNILYRIRERVKSVFHDSPILGGLVLGKEMEVSDALREDFIRAGIIHLFAVSGLHFGVIFLFLMGIFTLFLSKRKSALLAFSIISFYFFLVGPHPSVLRAYIMILLYVLSIFTYRDYDLLSSLSFAFLLLLIINPLEIKDPGFLLSFSSVFGIYLFNRMIDREVFIKPIYLFFLTFWIWMINIPIVINFFHRTPFFSIIFTPFLGTFAMFFIPFSFFIFFLALFSPNIALFFLSLIHPFSMLYRKIVHTVSSISLSSLNFPPLSFYQILTWYLFLGLIFYALKEKKKKLLIVVLSGISFVIILFLFYPLPLGIHFISVGEGDAIFINYPHGPNILIDGGNPYNGQRVVNYLRKKGVNRIDLLFITHPDMDHWGGLKDVVNQIKVDKIFINGQNTKDIGYNNFLKDIRKRHIYLSTVKRGDRFYIGDNFFLSILNPQSGYFFERDNDNSIVIGLHYGKFSVIFTGDLEAKGEQYLITHKLLAHYDILKVSHHGSKSSTTSIFLNTISPFCAIISVGKNRYGHPSEKVIGLLMRKGIEVHRTDIEGDISVYSYGDGWKIVSLRNRR